MGLTLDRYYNRIRIQRTTDAKTKPERDKIHEQLKIISRHHADRLHIKGTKAK